MHNDTFSQHLDITGVLADRIGPRLGLKASEIEAVAPRLKEIHAELEHKLGDPECLRKEMMAWMTLGHTEDETLKRIESYAREIQTQSDVLVVIGIGGSSLGAKALLHALKFVEGPCSRPEVYFLENADPETLRAFENRLSSRYGRVDYSRVAVNVISKSGTTAETAANFEIVLEHMKESGLTEADIARRVIATTDPVKGTLRGIAVEKGYRTLTVPDGVGGRFSVFSDVGLFPLAVGSVDIRALLNGAARGLECARRDPISPENHAYRLGSLLHLLDERKGAHLHGLYFYGEAFDGIAAWFEQLWAESLGKNGSGPRPLGMIGPRAQHGLYQDLAEGKPNKAVILVRTAAWRSDESVAGGSLRGFLETFASRTAADLIERGRPTMLFSIPAVNEVSLGELLFTLEMATHVAGRLYGVNPYDQPAVEEAKTGARRALSEAQKVSARQRRRPPIPAPVLTIQDSLAAGIGPAHGLSHDDLALTRERLAAIQDEIRDILEGGGGAQNPASKWLSSAGRVDVERLRAIAEKTAAHNDILVVTGIGGAALSGKAPVSALAYMGGKPKHPRILFLDNLDPEFPSRIEHLAAAFSGGRINYRRVAFNIVSQSGLTVETLLNMEVFRGRMMRAGLRRCELADRFIVTTNAGSGVLCAEAKANGYALIECDAAQMGLLGVFGAPGLFPLAAAGSDIPAFIRGIDRGRDRLRLAAMDPENFAFRISEVFYLLDTRKGKDLHGFFIYSDALKGVSEWIENLWIECLCKSETAGPRPLVMIGTVAQHSVNQDNIDGRNDKAILFTGVRSLRADYEMKGASVEYLAGNRMSGLLHACMAGTREALSARGRPSMTLELPRIDEETLGEYLVTMAAAAHIAARLYGVDPYRQPALEALKKKIGGLMPSPPAGEDLIPST